MGTPIEHLRTGTKVVVSATVDRVTTAAVHGTDAVIVRIPQSVSTPGHGDAMVIVDPDAVVEAERVLHYAEEHGRLAEWVLSQMTPQEQERYGSSPTGVVDWVMASPS